MDYVDAVTAGSVRSCVDDEEPQAVRAVAARPTAAHMAMSLFNIILLW